MNTVMCATLGIYGLPCDCEIIIIYIFTTIYNSPVTHYCGKANHYAKIVCIEGINCV